MAALAYVRLAKLCGFQPARIYLLDRDIAGPLSEKLEEANISGKKLENLNIQFGFIKTDTSLSTKDKVLKELIDEIDENINQFIS